MTSPDRCTSGSSYLLLGANTIPKAVEKHLHVGFVFRPFLCPKRGPKFGTQSGPNFWALYYKYERVPKIGTIFGPQKRNPFLTENHVFLLLNLLTPLALYWSYSCLHAGPQHWANGSPAMGVLGCGDEQEISNR